jgi:hypothetical protein
LAPALRPICGRELGRVKYFWGLYSVATDDLETGYRPLYDPTLRPAALLSLFSRDFGGQTEFACHGVHD